MAERMKGHRLFALLWDRQAGHERPALRAAREATAGGARGRVLELGVGVGSNWPHYPAGVSYVGIEPDPYMIQRARQHAARQHREVELHQAAAEALPFPDESFDAIVVTLTLCSVADLPRALGEARRVLRPGGELRFWEHVGAEHGIKRIALNAITPVWRRAAAGCTPNRHTEAAIRAAGFQVRVDDRSTFNGLPAIRGVAVKPAPRP